MTDLIYLLSWLVVVWVSGVTAYRLVKATLIYFFGTIYHLKVRNSEGKWVTITKRIKSDEDLDAWVLENYGPNGAARHD